MNKYRDWDILEELPAGWVVDEKTGSPLYDCVFITNGKSPLNGQKRALLRLKITRDLDQPRRIIRREVVVEAPPEPQVESAAFPAKTINALARLRFQKQLLKEIMFDLMVCEVEGWDKKEYIKELQKLLNSIDVSKKKKNSHAQQNLFDML